MQTTVAVHVKKDIHSPLEMYSPQPTEYTIKKGKYIIKHEQFEHFGKTTK